MFADMQQNKILTLFHLWLEKLAFEVSDSGSLQNFMDSMQSSLTLQLFSELLWCVLWHNSNKIQHDRFCGSLFLGVCKLEAHNQMITK